MAKVQLTFNKEILSFVFNKSRVVGPNMREPIAKEVVDAFSARFNNFTLNWIDPEPEADFILEVYLSYSNGRTSKWGLSCQQKFDKKQVRPEIKLISIDETEDNYKYNFEFSGILKSNYSPNAKMKSEHGGWADSIIELRLNFIENHKNPNAPQTGNIWFVEKDLKGKLGFTTDF